MASLKECRARAKKHQIRFIHIRKPRSEYQKEHPYIIGHYNARTVKETSEVLSRFIREGKQAEMTRKLNSHRPKYGYKTVPRKTRKKGG